MKFLNISCLLISLSLSLVSGYFMKREDYLDIEYSLKHASKECTAELAGALKCINKITSDIETKYEALEKLNVEICNPLNEKDLNAAQCKEVVQTGLNMGCDMLNIDECKDFLADDAITKIISSSKCGESLEEVDILSKLAAIKGTYLMVCGKNSSGGLCPLSNYVTNGAIDFMVENSKTISKLVEFKYRFDDDYEQYLDVANDVLTLLPILDKINNVIIDSCSDSACNKNIEALDKMAMASKALYEKKMNTDLTKKYPNVFNLYEEYFSNYRNGKCQNVGFYEGGSSGASTVKKISYTFVTMIGVSILLLL